MKKSLIITLILSLFLSLAAFAAPEAVEMPDTAEETNPELGEPVISETVEETDEETAELMGTFSDLTYGVSGGKVTIIDCSTSATSVIIPSTINGYPVTSIGISAFYNCKRLISVTIPDSVTSIGQSAFADCTGLTSVTIPDSVTSIDLDAFYKCTSLTSVTIGNSVTSIGSYAFYKCTSLSSITIPDSVTSIGYEAFRGCTSLTSVTIGNGVTSIGSFVFAGTGLKSITIPNSVTSISNNAFGGCSSLKSVTIGDSVTSIGKEAFYNCKNLTQINWNAKNVDDFVENNYVFAYAGQSGEGINVVFGDSVEKIPTYAFYPYSSSSDYAPKIVSAAIGKSVTSIGYYAFSNCTSLTSVTIPDSVTSIGDYVFRSCSSLTSIIIPDSVTWIGSSAFAGSGLTSIIIPDSVTWIGSSAFAGSGLTSIIIPDSVTWIGSSAFSNCKSLISVTIPDSVTSIGNYAFSNCTSLTSITVDEANEYYSIDEQGTLFNKDKTTLIQYPIGDTAIKYIIPDSVTSIGNFAFSDCTSLTSVTIGDSVTNIGNYAFSDCTSLTSVTIPDSATSIGSSAFSSCDSLASVTIGDSVASIGQFAFESCTGLASVTMGNSVTSIGHGAFRYCTGLTSITIPDSVTSIDTSAFSGCTSLSSVIIGNSVTSIGSSAFSNCTSLSSISIPDSVTSIESSAFRRCTSLTSITVDEANEYYSIDEQGTLFNKDKTTLIQYPIGTAAIKYIIPDSVTSIGDSAFNGCNSLTNITIPESVTSIGNSAFSDCTGLTSITIPESVTSIGYEVFYDCTRLKTIYYSGTEEKWNNIEIGDFNEWPKNVEIIYLGEPIIASGKCGDDLTWTLVENGFLTISGTGNMYNWSSGNAPWNSYLSSVKKVAIENGVTSIGDYAFYNCTSLKSITIPDGVTSIGSNAFDNTAYYNNSLNWYNNVLYIGNYLIEAKTSISGSYTIKYGTKLIGNNAFYNCRSLTSVTIPNSVTNIGSYAFYNCTSLTSVTIPNSVTNIGSYAFYKCTSLTSVTIGNGVTSIGSYAFAGSGLTSITIPDSVTSISNNVFGGCSGLTSITIPDSVTSIGSSAFYNTDYYNNSSNWDNDVLYIGNYLIDAKTSISGSYTINYGTKLIGNNAFYNCTSLASVTIPDSVTSIGNNAFDYCTSLTSVTIGNGVTSIGSYAFYKCPSLSSITIPDSVTSIGYEAFRGCTSLTSVTIGNGVTSIGSFVFASTGLKSITIPNSVTSISNNAFSYCNSLASVTIPDSVTSIGNNAFDYCTSLTSVTIGNGVTSIGDSAFYYCTKINTVFYNGFKEEWNKISIGSYNNSLNKANRVYLKKAIRYNANGGSGAPDVQSKQDGNDILLSSTVPERTGYTFLGWSTTSDGEVEYNPGDSYSKNEDVTLYAVWEKIIKYTISYDANGGSGAPKSQIKIYGTNLILSDTIPEREGYNFLGWSTTSDGEVEYNPGDSYSKNEDVTLYAVWEKITKYTISYDANGGSGAPKSQIKIYGTNLILSDTIPEREGYNFLGWSTISDSDVEYNPGGSYSKNGDVTLYAVWQLKTYSVTYNANGGTNAPRSQSKKYFDNIVLTSSVPGRTGYAFLGWSTTADGEVEYNSGDSYSKNEDVTLYAVWAVNEYIISYNANGGSGEPDNQTKTYGSDLVLSIKIPTKTGYVFLGWSTTVDATVPEYKAGAIYKANDDVELYAVWTEAIASKKVKLSRTTASMAVGGEDLLLTAILTPENSTDTLTWSVDKPEIATVDKNGVVTAHKAGKVKITATTGSGKKATCTITVGAPADTVTFSSIKSTSLAVGKTLTLKAKASCEDGTKPVSTNVVYEIIEGEEYATIDAKGKLVGKDIGTVVVRARAEAGTEDAYADVIINVCIPATKVTLNTTKASMALGYGDLELSATMLPADNTDTLTWSVDKPEIATVDENGVVTAYTTGKVKVIAMTGSGKKATCTVTIGEPATKVVVTALKTTSVAVGKSITLKGKAACEGKTKPVSTAVVFDIIEGDDIATIDAKGKLTAKAEGTVVVRISAEVGTEEAYEDVEIRICNLATKVTLNMTKATIAVDDELQLEATMTAKGECTDTLYWSVDKPDIATVDENGLVTAHSAGKVKVTATSGSGKKATCTITVTK